MYGGFLLMLMHLPLIPLPKMLKSMIMLCEKKNMKKTQIYNIIFYSFLIFKMTLFLYQIEFSILKKNHIFPEMQKFPFYEI